MMHETRRVKPRRANKAIDAHVGARLRLRRMLLGMSQEKLARTIGLSFQQVQKYECGNNRIGAGRLYDLARALDVPVSFFYEDIAPVPAEPPKSAKSDAAAVKDEAVAVHPGAPVMNRETLELVRAYLKITDPQLRRRVFELAKAIAKL
jgi:transcriptional regulator with XRE-family HTH domain